MNVLIKEYYQDFRSTGMKAAQALQYARISFGLHVINKTGNKPTKEI